jgi:glycosyltransferase involved in cell wall biosynthesis
MTTALEPATTHPAAPAEGRPLRWLFVKERFAWPRASGHDVHTHGLMRALAELGHAVAVATLDPPPPEALADIPFAARYCLAEGNPPVPPGDAFPLRFTKAQAKFCSYWGVREDHVRQVATAAADCAADVVVVSGLNVLPFLGAIAGRACVWYAADEWVWHHLSLVRPFHRSTWGEVRPAVVKGLYERAYRKRLDRVWVVTDADARAFRWFAGVRNLDVIPNGVDAEHYRPEPAEAVPNSCAFWGRLDFGPNVQALEWFAAKVWPRVRAQVPDARLRIFGFQPTSPVRALAGRDGIDLTPDLPDLRPAVRRCQVALFPFVSGGGIKNKLLEAAALGLPAVCTPRALSGLKGPVPFRPLSSPAEWAGELIGLWADAERRRALGEAARAWVAANHTWRAAARTAVEGIREAVEKVKA